MIIHKESHVLLQRTASLHVKRSGDVGGRHMESWFHKWCPAVEETLAGKSLILPSYILSRFVSGD